MTKHNSVRATLFGKGRDKVKYINHTLLDCNVHYLGNVWRVTVAYQGATPDLEPWLVLRRGTTEVTAKPHEVVLAFD